MKTLKKIFAIIVLIVKNPADAVDTSKDYFPYNCPPYAKGRLGRNPNLMLHDIEFGSVRTFHGDLEICKLCFDGILPTGAETLDLPDTGKWIGLYRSADSSVWKWMDGTLLDMDNLDHYTDYFNSDQLTPDKDYGVLRFKVYDKVIWIALEKGAKCVIDSIKSFKDDELIQMRLITENGVYLISDKVYGEDRRDAYSIVCQRSYRPEIHHWNYSESECRWNTKGFSYNYFMPQCHPGDFDKNRKHCNKVDIWRTASRCDETSPSVCRVTAWSEWSFCDMASCEVTTRKRTKLDEPTCRTYYPHLDEWKNCTNAISYYKLRSGKVTTWSQWSYCNAMYCDKPIGVRMRTRQAVKDHGCQSYPHLEENIRCLLPGC